MLSVLIMGAGAVGCFVGGSLAAAGHRVTLLGRAPLMNKIAETGLTIQWPQQPPQTVRPDTATAVDQLGTTFDFILLTVKTPSTPATVEQLATLPLESAQTYLISLQNGIGNEEQLAAKFGPDKVIAGTITIPVAVPELGTIEVSKAKGGLGLAPLFESQPVEILADALNRAGLTTAIYADYRAMKWSKLLLNIVNNATSAILNLPPAKIIARPDLFDLEIEAVQEGVTVMKAQGIEVVSLPSYPVQWLARLVSARWLPRTIVRAILRPAMLSGRGTKMPSLHIDLAAGRSTSEIQALNGAIAESGKELGIPTPVNQTLTEIFSGLVSGQLSWSEYQNQPAKLIAAVAAARQ